MSACDEEKKKEIYIYIYEVFLKEGGSGPCKGWFWPPSLPLYWAIHIHTVSGSLCFCLVILLRLQLLLLLFPSYSYCLGFHRHYIHVHLCILHTCCQRASDSPPLLYYPPRIASRASGYTHTNEILARLKKNTICHSTLI